LKFILPIAVLVLTLFSFNEITKTPEEKDKVLVSLLRHVLSNYHFDPQEIDDEFSERLGLDILEDNQSDS